MDSGSHLSTMVSLQPFSIPAPFVSLSNAYFMLFCYSQLVVLFLLLNVSGIWAMQAAAARAMLTGPSMRRQPTRSRANADAKETDHGMTATRPLLLSVIRGSSRSDTSAEPT